MSARDIEERIEMTERVRELLKRSAEKLNLSPRSYHRLIKVSRTIADLENSDELKESHILEALHFRAKQWKMLELLLIFLLYQSSSEAAPSLLQLIFKPCTKQVLPKT